MRDKETHEYLLSNLQSNRDHVAELIERADGCDDEASDELVDYTLSVDPIVTVRVWLTLGGPNIFIDVEMGKGQYGWEAGRCVWNGHWGGTSIERGLSDNEPLARWASGEAELRMEGEF